MRNLTNSELNYIVNCDEVMYESPYEKYVTEITLNDIILSSYDTVKNDLVFSYDYNTSERLKSLYRIAYMWKYEGLDDVTIKKYVTELSKLFNILDVDVNTIIDGAINNCIID